MLERSAATMQKQSAVSGVFCHLTDIFNYAYFYIRIYCDLFGSV